MTETPTSYESELRRVIEEQPEAFNELVALCDEFIELSQYVPSNERVMLAEFIFAVVTVLVFASQLAIFFEQGQGDISLREYLTTLASFLGGLASSALIYSLVEEWWYKRRLPYKEALLKIKLFGLQQELFQESPLMDENLRQLAQRVSQFADQFVEEKLSDNS